GHVGAVDRIDVTARTDVDADILAPAEKRSRTRLSSSMKNGRRWRVVHGLRGSLRGAKRPSVKSITTCAAPADKHERMSFSHSLTMSSSNCLRGYPVTSPSSG